MAGVTRLQNSLLRNILPVLSRRLISTSQQKQSETASAVKQVIKSESVNKNWMSYGFETNNKEEDRIAAHSTMFVTVTLCVVFACFYAAYLPDYNLRDWTQREAFLELRRREAAGLPLVDPNLIDPNTIVLPSDEELGDTEIII